MLQTFIRIKKGRALNMQVLLRQAQVSGTYESLGYLLDIGTSTHFNAPKVLGTTTPEFYFYHSTNKTFHDRTNRSSLPAAVPSILGMGMKFIPTPTWTPTPTVIEVSVNQFE
jgi:hypothetical protein